MRVAAASLLQWSWTFGAFARTQTQMHLGMHPKPDIHPPSSHLSTPTRAQDVTKLVASGSVHSWQGFLSLWKNYCKRKRRILSAHFVVVLTSRPDLWSEGG